MSDIILKAENLKKSFKENNAELIAVKDVSFELIRGHALGIAGGSGSGKSTVARMLMHIIEPDGGSMFLDGSDITRLNGKALKEYYHKVQLVFQQPKESFDPRLKLGDGISEGLINMGINKKEALNKGRKLLEHCGLSDEFADRYPHQVSGGQCQRAAIARALSVKPEIIILDEATSALDVMSQRQILSLLMDLKNNDGISFIMISHDLALIKAFCDEVLIMNKGSVEESGSIDEVIGAPKTEYTKRLIEAVL